MSASEAVACYRLYAAYCVELAQDPLEPSRKVALLNMAQAWARLADQVEKNGDAELVFELLPPGRHHP